MSSEHKRGIDLRPKAGTRQWSSLQCAHCSPRGMQAAEPPSFPSNPCPATYSFGGLGQVISPRHASVSPQCCYENQMHPHTSTEALLCLWDWRENPSGEVDTGISSGAPCLPQSGAWFPSGSRGLEDSKQGSGFRKLPGHRGSSVGEDEAHQSLACISEAWQGGRPHPHGGKGAGVEQTALRNAKRQRRLAWGTKCDRQTEHKAPPCGWEDSRSEPELGAHPRLRPLARVAQKRTHTPGSSVLPFFFKILFIYLTEREHKQGQGQEQRERGRQAPCSVELDPRTWDHGLSRRQTLHQRSPPGAPRAFSSPAPQNQKDSSRPSSVLGQLSHAPKNPPAA